MKKHEDASLDKIYKRLEEHSTHGVVEIQYMFYPASTMKKIKKLEKMKRVKKSGGLYILINNNKQIR